MDCNKDNFVPLTMISRQNLDGLKFYVMATF